MKVAKKTCGPFLLILSVLISSLLLTSCLSHDKIRYSHPYLDTKKLKNIELESNDFTLYIRATNLFLLEDNNERLMGAYFYQARSLGDWAYINRDKFIIELLIEPNISINISPSQFGLHLGKKLLKAKVYRAEALGTPRSSQRFLGTLCDFRVKDEKGIINYYSSESYQFQKRHEVREDVMLAPQMKHCFALSFDIPPPDPSRSFSLDLGRVGANNSMSTVVHFKESKDSWIHN